MFDRRDPDQSKTPGTERDVFNEKPSKEDMIAATDAIGTFNACVNFEETSKFVFGLRHPKSLRFSRHTYNYWRHSFAAFWKTVPEDCRELLRSQQERLL